MKSILSGLYQIYLYATCMNPLYCWIAGNELIYLIWCMNNGIIYCFNIQQLMSVAIQTYRPRLPLCMPRRFSLFKENLHFLHYISRKLHALVLTLFPSLQGTLTERASMLRRDPLHSMCVHFLLTLWVFCTARVVCCHRREEHYRQKYALIK